MKKNNLDNSPQIEKINKKLNKYQMFLKKNNEELEKNKNNSNNSNANIMLKKEDIDIIQNSKYEDSIANQPTIEQVQPPQTNPNIRQSMINRKSIQIDYDPTYLIDMKKFTYCVAKRTVEDHKQWFLDYKTLMDKYSNELDEVETIYDWFSKEDLQLLDRWYICDCGYERTMSLFIFFYQMRMSI